MESLLLLTLEESKTLVVPFFAQPVSQSMLTLRCNVHWGSSAEASGHLQEIPEGTSSLWSSFFSLGNVLNYTNKGTCPKSSSPEFYPTPNLTEFEISYSLLIIFFQSQSLMQNIIHMHTHDWGRRSQNAGLLSQSIVRGQNCMFMSITDVIWDQLVCALCLLLPGYRHLLKKWPPVDSKWGNL